MTMTTNQQAAAVEEIDGTIAMTETALINRAAVIRLYPNREQAAALRRWQGGLRFVWNNAWAWCKE